MYNVCAGLELNSVGMKVGVVVCRQRCSEHLRMVSIDTAVELSGLPGSHGRVHWLRKR